MVAYPWSLIICVYYHMHQHTGVVSKAPEQGYSVQGLCGTGSAFKTSGSQDECFAGRKV